MATSNSVVNAILGVTSNQEIREAMLLGSRLESGWNPSAVGDNGTSFGPFQMHIGGELTAQGGTPAQAEDPVWAAQHMLGAYTQGVRQVPQSLWQSDPERASEEAAVIAEGPAQPYYASQGTAAVDAAWQATQNALKGIVSSPGGPSGSSTGTTGAVLTSGPFPGGNFDPFNWPFAIFGGAQNIGSSIEHGITSAIWGAIKSSFAHIFNVSGLKDFFIRFGLILLGGAILLIGIRAFIQSGGTIVEYGGAATSSGSPGEFVSKK